MSVVPAPALSLAQLAEACRFGRADDLSQPAAYPTGFDKLDAALPFGGWPIGAVTEIMPRIEGIGELKLTMPAVAALSRERHIAFVAPPYLPYPPALAQQGINLERVLFIDRGVLVESPELLWAAEQMLRCPAFGAVLVWPQNVNDKELRRLQLAAEAGKNLALVYRPPIAAASSSPAALRLCLSSTDRALQIEIKKCRGGRAGKIVRIGANDADDISGQRVA